MDDELREIRSPFDELIGTDWISDDPASARVKLDLRDDLRQPFGLLHGGVMSSLVESICSRATAMAVFGEGMIAMGQTITVSFLRPVTRGSVEVRATARHRGRTTWVWDAEVLDDHEKICALAQMTIAVRALPGS
jgi:1,4-dihydroxy-2-naphthoyl-CoA hydrolase